MNSETIKKSFTCKKDSNGDFIKLNGMSCGYYNAEPMELESWQEKTDNTHDLSSIEIMALFYAGLQFIKENSEVFGIDPKDDVDDSIQGGSLYLNGFEGYILPLPDGTIVRISRITYTTNMAIIACGYEVDENGYTTADEKERACGYEVDENGYTTADEKERAWLLT